MAEGKEKHRWLKPVMTAGTILFFLLLGGLCVYAWRAGLFRDIDRLQAFIQRCGVWAPLVFVLMQVTQILLAFIPGGLLLSGGVAAFGPWLGLLYNMAGTLLGSALNFAIAKRWGRPLAKRLMPEKTWNKYVGWLDENQTRFQRFFAVAILLPFFPDDALCLVAGLTQLRWKAFLLILLLKLPSVAAYSLAYLGLFRFLPLG